MFTHVSNNMQTFLTGPLFYTPAHTQEHLPYSSLQLTKCLGQSRKVKPFKSCLLHPFFSLFTTGGPMNSGNPGHSDSYFSKTHCGT